MNDFDRENVNFLLTASKADMEEWHRYATDDDYTYALEILRAARSELELQELALLDSEVTEMYECELVEAQSVLSKFALK